MSLLQKKSNPAATAVNNAGNGHGAVVGVEPEEIKIGRAPMHDDSGATTGLRMRPDYGESDAYTTKMNEENSKGAAAGCLVAVKPTAVKAAAEGEMYVSSIEFSTKNPTKVAKFSFTADRDAAMVFHRMTAMDVVRQISSVAFGVPAHVVLAYNYEDMFKTLERLVPKTEPTIKREIQWCKSVLKKQDRIVWFLRWYRLALIESIINELPKKPVPATVQPPVQASVKKADDAAGTQMAPQPETQPPPPKNMTLEGQLEKLVTQYQKELKSKGGNPDIHITINDFPAMKRTLEHFYSLPIPDIQNRVLKAESYSDVYQAFSIAENEWKEQATRMLKPHKEDKVFKQFSDGWAWWWLPRAACDEESKAMGHCGNSPRRGEKNVSILSLREPKQYGKEKLWYPHLTFILNGPGETGVLGEMKGRNNDKPVPKYHPYIIELLKDPRIKGIVGGGYLPEHNFSMNDLTKEQRMEIAAVNPNVGTTIRDYYEEHGMDENLEQRIRTVLELPESARYDDNYGFIIHEWKSQGEFINDCGDREAKKAWRFTETGELDNDEPDGDELADLIDHLDSSHQYNVGLGIQYYYAREIREWYRDREGNVRFDPKNPEWLKQAVNDIYEMKVSGGIDAWNKARRKPEEEESHPAQGDEVDTDAERAKAKPKKQQPKVQNPYDIPVIKEFYYAYLSGGPDQDTIGELLDEQMQKSMNEENTQIEYYKSSILQIVEPEIAVDAAAKVEANQGNRRYHDGFDKPTISMPYDWDDWSEERASESLRYYFEKPPKRPEMEKQKRLFKEPKDEAEAKRRGITISKLLKSKLFYQA